MSASKWKPYPDMMDSGFSWSGKIPNHWELKPIKFFARLGQEKSDVIPSRVPYIALEHIESGTGIFDVDTDIVEIGSSVSLFSNGDVLFSKLRPYLAKVIRPEFDGCCSSELIVLEDNQNIDSLFLKYLLLSSVFIDHINATTYGVKMPRASPDSFGSIKIPSPNLEEQKSIGQFLENENKSINNTIDVLEKIVSTLEQKRSALITQAVTKGLDHSVLMKDSGIESLGRIPEHWHVTPLKRNWDVIDCKHVTPTYTDEGIHYVYIPEVKPVRLEPKNATRFVSYEDYLFLNDGRMPSKGDVIYCRNASLGIASYVDTDDSFVLGQDLVLITSKHNKGLFLTYLLNSSAVTSQIESEGVGSTFKRINVGQIKELLLSIPPPDEQEEIAIFCDKVHIQISSLISKTELEIVRLNEYRTALISAAVTGKIDVRLL